MGNLVLYSLLSSNVKQIRKADSSIIFKHWWDWGDSSSNPLFEHRNTKARKSVYKLNLKTTKDSKEESLRNDLVERIQKDPYFSPIADQLKGDINTKGGLFDPSTFIGRAPEQVDEFIISLSDT